MNEVLNLNIGEKIKIIQAPNATKSSGCLNGSKIRPERQRSLSTSIDRQSSLNHLVGMNNYHIYEEIASGKNCVIYKGRRKQTIDYYAVKSYEKCRRNKLMNEVKVASALEHENILRFYNWYETKNHLWVILEYASGGNFQQLLDQDKKLTENQIKIFAKELVQGLLYIHSKGVIYCDLKPSKILLNEYGTLKLCDFGFARRLVDLIQTDQEVKEGSKKGTPSYMAPELFEEDGVFSLQSDIWALGCMLYEMAVGQPPFYSQSIIGLIQLIESKEVQKVNGFSNEFNSLVLGLLEKNPLKRIQWNQILLHPFLNFNQIHLKNLLQIQLPPQPHFERWASLKYPSNIQYVRQIPSKEVNALRISLNAKKNFKKELIEQRDNYKTSNEYKSEGDFILLNKDQILDIGNNQNMSNNDNFDTSNKSTNINYEDSNQLTSANNIYSNNQQMSPWNNSNVSNYLSNAGISNCNSTGIYNSNNNKRSQQDQENILTSDVRSASKSPCHANQLENSTNNSKKQNEGPVKVILNKNQPQQLANHVNLVSSQSQQKLENSSRSRLGQQNQMESSRQGAQTPTSPNNLHRTPPHPKQDNLSNYYNLQGASSRTNNSNSQRQAQLTKTPSTPLNSHTKSVSPYQASAKIIKATSIMNATPQINSFGTSGNSNTSNQQLKVQVHPHHQHTLSAHNVNQQIMSPNKSKGFNLSGISLNQIENSGRSSSSNKNVSGQEQKTNLNPQQIGQPNQNKKPSFVIETVEKLLCHATDTQVKPIIGQSEQEKIEENRFKYDLPFLSLTAEEVEKGQGTPEIDAHFSQIYSFLLQSNSDKYSILSYFESIIQNSKVSNWLINSTFLNFLLDLLQNQKQPQVRLRSASCIGFLLRFATEIEIGLSSMNIPAIIIGAFTIERDFKVKRKLMATLGEYLFYAATQVEDNPQASPWRIQPTNAQLLVNVIKNVEEDEVVRFYACKTIENITSQSGIVGQLFCNSDSIISLSHTYFSAQSEELKTSSIATLYHISRQQGILTDTILDSLGGLGKLKDIMKNETSTHKLQQAALSLFNRKIFLFSRNSQAAQLYIDPQLLEFIVSLLESTHTVIRGKSLLSIYLCIKMDICNFICLSQTKFWVFIEKMTRDNFKYTQQCFYHLKNQLKESLPYLLKAVSEDIMNLSRGELPIQIISNIKFQQYLPGRLQFLNSIISLGMCSETRVALFEKAQLEECFELFDIVHSSIQESLVQSRELVMNIFEIILGNQPLVIEKLDFFFGIIIPKLLDSLNICLLKNQSPTWKFNSVKLIHDLAAVFAPEWQKWSQQQLQRVNELFANKFIGGTLQTLLLSQEEPVKVLVFRILQALIDSQQTFFLADLRQKGMVSLILQQFTQNASRSVLKISAKIAETASLQEITQYGLAQKATQLLQVFYARQQDQCIEDILDVLIAVCIKACSPKPLQNLDKPCSIEIFIDQILNQQQQESILNAYTIYCNLVPSIDGSIADKSATLIIYSLYLFAKSSRNGINQTYFRSENIMQMINYVTSLPQLKRNIRVLNWMIQLLSIQRDFKDQVSNSISKIIWQQKDSSIASALREILIFVH